ncbi:hypothetical protein [Mesorhizobium sp. RMAD-H1]|uniref:hypothetical protein n=1 Tax=Mesorhizobium sp. RMAD-H1 TaxID=2587065 RepID=UPI00161D1860|nr:hypothetical protein [Mesorhizobium sp. RMAD-H1]MBB2972740.1 membrane-bound ClpP family serine protease [Mesorhizobium sp. RMAD-H1]
MGAYDEVRSPFINKLVGLALVILGFLLVAAGYRSGQAWYIGGGIISLILGLFLLVTKIIRRNQGSRR